MYMLHLFSLICYMDSLRAFFYLCRLAFCRVFFLPLDLANHLCTDRVLDLSHIYCQAPGLARYNSNAFRKGLTLDYRWPTDF